MVLMRSSLMCAVQQQHRRLLWLPPLLWLLLLPTSGKTITAWVEVAVLSRHRSPSRSSSLTTAAAATGRATTRLLDGTTWNGAEQPENSFSNGQVDSNSNKIPQPNKGDVYANDELQNLLNIHAALSPTVSGFGSSTREEKMVRTDPIPGFPSLQDLVEQTVKEIETNAGVVATPTDSTINQDDDDAAATAEQLLKFDSSIPPDELKQILPKIRAIASDVDGTLLSSLKHTMHPLTNRAIRSAVEAAFSPVHPLQVFFPATGKTRPGAFRSLGPDIQALLQHCPGVFVQGLYCVDNTGKVIFERKLTRTAVEETEALALQCGVSLICYDGDVLYATEHSRDNHIEACHVTYGEPTPILLRGKIADQHPAGFHKLLFMDDNPEFLNNEVRPLLQQLATKLDCVVTQAIPTMLELLPSGCSKAVGVQKVCEHLGLDMGTQLCAIGDAENDLDMLRLAAVGVAVGNAIPIVQDVADIVVHETSDQGGAGRAIDLFGLGQALDLL
jgi:hydroxymethylpyrimidine pyrophosphatase-like HAD family hydrolase